MTFTSGFSRRLGLLLTAAFLIQFRSFAEKLRPEAPSGSSSSNTVSQRTVLRVRPPLTPLGENSVDSLSAAEGRKDLSSLSQDLVRNRLHEPHPKSLMEQGGLGRVLITDPKPKKILGLLNPLAPLNQSNSLQTPQPLPYFQQDFIRAESIAIPLFSWRW